VHAILGQRPLLQLQRVDRRMWRIHLTGTLRADLDVTDSLPALSTSPRAADAAQRGLPTTPA
jgi:hypothetical protein